LLPYQPTEGLNALLRRTMRAVAFPRLSSFTIFILTFGLFAAPGASADAGIVLNESIGALAHLQIGRAYAMQGDTAKAKAAYQDFLTLWKDADPDIPVLIAAKSEYAKLK